MERTTVSPTKENNYDVKQDVLRKIWSALQGRYTKENEEKELRVDDCHLREAKR